MTPFEPIYPSVFPNSNDPQGPEPYEPEPDASSSYPDDYDEPPPQPRKPRRHIYEQYFTPEEREMLAAIPEGDMSGEINLLRALLAHTFALVPTGPSDKKRPLTLKFQYDLLTTVSRVAIVIARLAALYLKQHPKKDTMFETMLEMIRQVNIEQGVV